MNMRTALLFLLFLLHSCSNIHFIHYTASLLLILLKIILSFDQKIILKSDRLVSLEVKPRLKCCITRSGNVCHYTTHHTLLIFCHCMSMSYLNIEKKYDCVNHLQTKEIDWLSHGHTVYNPNPTVSPDKNSDNGQLCKTMFNCFSFKNHCF